MLLLALVWGELLVAHDFPLIREETDGVDYLYRALGPWLAPDLFHGPGFPWGIRLVAGTGLAPFRAAQFLSLLAGLGLLAAAGAATVSRRRAPFDHRFLLILLLGLHPTVIKLAVSPMSDITGAALLFAALALRPRRAPGYLLSGALLGLAALVRLPLATVVPLALLGSFLDDPRPLRARLGGLGLSILAFLVVLAPPLLFANGGWTGPFINAFAANLAFALDGRALGWRAFPEDVTGTGLVALIAADPLALLVHTARGVLASLEALPDPLRVLGLFALAGAWRWVREAEPHRLLLLGMLAILGAPVALTWVEARFLLPMLPIFLALVVSGWTWGRSLLRRPAATRAWGLLGLGLLLILAGRSHRRIADFLVSQPTEYQQMAGVLARIGPPGATVLAAKPHVPFFAGMRWVRLRDLGAAHPDPVGFWNALAPLDVDYLIWDARYTGVEWPELAWLGQPEGLDRWGPLRVERVIESPQRIVLYSPRTSDQRQPASEASAKETIR